MNGFLLVDKPVGWTSHDVVAYVRKILRTADSDKRLAVSPKKLTANSQQLTAPSPKVKVGHTGTLDPAATGLLILVLGSWCKRAGEFSKLDKTYEVGAMLGATSTTGDAEGIISKPQALSSFGRSSEIVPKAVEVKRVMANFLGRQKQTPPAYSAIKIAGQRAYRLARAGKTVKLEPRSITIYGISNVKYAYPRLSFTVKVSSGTYIRSLVKDIGQKLGCGAYQSALRRTQVSNFNVKEAIILMSKPDFDVLQKSIRTTLALKE